MFNKYVRNLLVWALILMVVLWLVLPLYNKRGTSSEAMPYSEFVSEAQQGHIDQVTIGDEDVSGRMKNGRQSPPPPPSVRHGCFAFIRLVSPHRRMRRM